MTAAPLIFMDTETTGLALDDDIWEFAAIRRDPDGHEEQLHLFIEHDEAKCARLPDLFAIGHVARFPAACSGKIHTRTQAAILIGELTAHREGEPAPHIVGAVPNFDTERVARLLAHVRREPGWHYHLIDVENLAVGYLAAQDGRTIAPPWDSDTLANLVGVAPQPEGTRHTAMGDVLWVRDIYDHIMNTKGA